MLFAVARLVTYFNKWRLKEMRRLAASASNAANVPHEMV